MQDVLTLVCVEDEAAVVEGLVGDLLGLVLCALPGMLGMPSISVLDLVRHPVQPCSLDGALPFPAATHRGTKVALGVGLGLQREPWCWHEELHCAAELGHWCYVLCSGWAVCTPHLEHPGLWPVLVYCCTGQQHRRCGHAGGGRPDSPQSWALSLSLYYF